RRGGRAAGSGRPGCRPSTSGCRSAGAGGSAGSTTAGGWAGPRPPRGGGGARGALRRHDGGGWTVTDQQRGLTWWFERRSGYFWSAAGEGELPLVAVTDRAGHEVSFGYDRDGAPAGIRHSGGYHVRVLVAGGRITGLACGGAGDGAGSAATS